MLNLLATLSTTSLGYGVSTIPDISLNWIGQLIRILIEGIGVTGVGIIVFTLILKTIVLPLDIYSRINGKKQALIMERMRPQMEKLQKQYANDKTMYNQKVMELQKKSGYSMFGACLPMIVSLVIFIIVFNAFSTYSQYANLNTYNKMVGVYNDVVETYVITDSDTTGKFLYAVDSDGNGITYDADGNITGDKEVSDYVVDYDLFAAAYGSSVEKTFSSSDEAFTALAQVYKKSHSGYSGSVDFSMVNDTEDGKLTLTAESLRNVLVNYFLEEPAANAVEEYYEQGNDSHFLWVKNLWYPDSTLNKEIPSFSKFKSTITKASISDADEEIYEKVTASLEDQKNAYNGYYVLIVLSIGLMLLQQWLSMRSNKAVNDLSTVDGSGARTNKMMMIMMPIIYGIFSFFYSAAFSIYMITNTLFGLTTMLIINKCVDVWFKKKEANGQLDEILTKKSGKKKAGKKTSRR